MQGIHARCHGGRGRWSSSSPLFWLMDIFKLLQEGRITELSLYESRKMFSVFPSRKATLLSFPNIWARRKGFKSFGFHQRMLLWEANKYWLIFSPWGKMKANFSERILWPTDMVLLFQSFVLLSFSFPIAFIFSLQTQRTVCLYCAGTITGYALVGLCPWRVWYTVVCWKVLASKDKGLY